MDFALIVPGGVDVVALSFVQKAADVQELKDIVQGRCRVSALTTARNVLRSTLPCSCRLSCVFTAVGYRQLHGDYARHVG